MINRTIYYIIQVKKKAFKINAKIEDVGLNEDLAQIFTHPILSFLHPFVSIRNKTLSGDSDIWYIISSKRGTE